MSAPGGLPPLPSRSDQPAIYAVPELPGARRLALAALAQRQTAILSELRPLLDAHGSNGAHYCAAIAEAFHRALHAGGAYATATEVRGG